MWDISQSNVSVLAIASILSRVPGISSIVSVTIRRSNDVNYSSNSINLGGTDGIAPLPIGNSVTGSVGLNPIDSTLGGL